MAKKINIDWKEFEAQCAMQCTLREIADYFNCSEDTIERRVREHYNCGFADIFKRKRVKGLMSLRASLFKLGGKQGNVAIFLAKNWLGMKDRQEIEHSGHILSEADISDKDLQKIIEEGSSKGTHKKAHRPK